MTYLVFVHGVATRAGKEYDRAISNRNKLISKVLFGGGKVDISSPYWGSHVPTIDEKVYETNAPDVESFRVGVGDYGPGGAGGGGSPNDAPSVSAVGKQAPRNALDAIFAELLETAAVKDRGLKDEELEAFARAVDRIEAGTEQNFFEGDLTDDELSDRLNDDGTASYGIKNAISSAVTAISDRISNTVSTLGFGAVRDTLSPQVGIFLGDVFAYLKEGHTRDAIRKTVATALSQAHAAAVKEKRPLVLIGHSLGGVILTDMLLKPKEAGLPEDICVAALLTVGSQPGFFASLNLLAHPRASATRISRPACVKDWMNVFDPIDPFAFRTDAIFDGSQDLVFDTVSGLMSSHSAYFHRPQFYARARKRFRDIGIAEG